MHSQENLKPELAIQHYIVGESHWWEQKRNTSRVDSKVLKPHSAFHGYNTNK